MKVDHKTFCAAPWFQIRNSSKGQFIPCCEIDTNRSSFSGKKSFGWPNDSINDYLNSDYSKYLKEKLTTGTKLPECNRCWSMEKNNQVSLRQKINDDITRSQPFGKSWLKAYFDKKHDHTHDLLTSADIKLTNICNFSCLMCNPADSSQIYRSWEKQKNNYFVAKVLDKDPTYFEDIKYIYKEKQSYQLLRDVISNGVKYIKLLGGEPLIDEPALQILEQVPLDKKEKITLFFVTNGSINLSSITQRLEGYKDVLFSISLEGIGPVQDFVRQNSNWQNIENNIDEYISKYGTTKLGIAHTIQALTLFHFDKLYNWCEKKSIRISIAILHDPDYLSLECIPTNLKKQIVKKLKGITPIGNLHIFLSTHSVNVESLDKILEDVKFNNKKLQELKKFLEWVDSEQKWKHILPEWLPYLS